MTDEQKRYFLISAIFIFLFLIMIDLLILNRRIDKANELFYERHLKNLESQFNTTQKKIDSLNVILLSGQKELKKIADQKDKLKAIYVNTNKKIDTLSGSQLVYEFNLFFSKVTKK